MQERLMRGKGWRWKQESSLGTWSRRQRPDKRYAWPNIVSFPKTRKWAQCLEWYVPYSRKISREKTFMNWWKIQKIFAGCLLMPSKDALLSNFMEKIFANSQNASKFVKWSPLKVFGYIVLVLQEACRNCIFQSGTSSFWWFWTLVSRLAFWWLTVCRILHGMIYKKLRKVQVSWGSREQAVRQIFSTSSLQFGSKYE